MFACLRRWISTALLIAGLAGAVAAGAAEVETLPLWPDRAPVGGGQFETLRGQASPRAVWREAMPIGDGTPEVVYPQMTVFHPAPDRATGAAIVICVGGGYMRLVLPHEGPRVAQWLASHGVLAVVAEYRMPRGRPEVPLADAQRALRIVRSRAREWKVDPARVGIMGFSAGGHLASTAGTHFDAGDPPAADPIARQSSRPDFMVLIYPVISMGSRTHAVSKQHLLGANPTPAQVALYSNELQVTPRTPPTFLAHAADDKSVPAENSRMFFESLRASGVPAEYLELPTGGHGLREEKVWEAWKAGALAWLKTQQIIATPARPADAAHGTHRQADWPTYLGNKARNLYSPLAQIDRSNVARLEMAWSYDTGEKAPYQTNNLILGRVLYTVAPASRRVIALDATSGRELWIWDGGRPGQVGAARQSRGLVYWQNEQGGERRLFSAEGSYLYAIDPATGETIRSFGEDGAAHLGTGFDDLGTTAVNYNTPGVIYRDLLIFGVSAGSPRGIRAMDTRTGKIRWHFHTAPLPGEFGYDTWPAGYDRSSISANDWSGQALDEARGIVYASTKTAAPDFLGANRQGQNLFANCIIALDAATGKRLWHFQIVHHDLLDKDLPCAPVLLTVTHGGRKIDAVAQGTKHGLLFVFDRLTGEPLWPIEERPVPPSDLVGERAWPTQPFPTKPAPLMRQFYTEADVSTISPEAQALTLARIRNSPNFGPFPAPSLRESIMFPGYNGGMEWGGGAADPDGIYYVNVNEVPWFLQMVETRNPDGSPLAPGEQDYRGLCAACHGLDRKGNPSIGFPSLIDVGLRRTRADIERLLAQGAGMMPPFDRLRETQRRAVIDFMLGVPPAAGRAAKAPAAAAEQTYPRYAFAGFRKFIDQQGYPAIKPPWGTLNAVDLNTGEIKWKVPLGEYAELTARGIPQTGTENYGGPVVTAGGLLFIGATADQMIRAFDKDTGHVLWQAKLPFGGIATPSTYQVDGRQYVVIAAGGSRWGGPLGGMLVAFALPQTLVAP